MTALIGLAHCISAGNEKDRRDSVHCLDSIVMTHQIRRIIVPTPILLNTVLDVVFLAIDLVTLPLRMILVFVLEEDSNPWLAGFGAQEYL